MKKQFDLGIYQFHRVISGPLCPPDDAKAKEGEMFAVLHPMVKADPDSMYCFGINQAGEVLTLMRKNLKFKKAVTLPIESNEKQAYHEQVHAKLTIAQKYLQTNEQLSL